MTEGYKLIQDNLGEYNILRKDNTLVCSEIQNKAEAELILDELNEVYQYYQELKTEYTRLHKVHGLLHDNCLELEIERDNFKKENEELKEDKAILKHALRKLVEEFDDRISDKSPVRDLIKEEVIFSWRAPNGERRHIHRVVRDNEDENNE